MRLFSDTSRMTSKYGKEKNVAREAQSSVSLILLPHFNVFWGLLLYMESICFIL